MDRCSIEAKLHCIVSLTEIMMEQLLTLTEATEMLVQLVEDKDCVDASGRIASQIIDNKDEIYELLTQHLNNEKD